MIVEFVGLSGVGKSTLLRDVEGRLQTAAVAVTAHDARSAVSHGLVGASSQRRNLARGALRAPRVATLAARTLRDSRGFSLRRYLGSIGYVTTLRRSTGVHLIDEGPLKRLPTSEPFASWWPGLMAALPKADLIVHVVCDSDVRIERVRQLDRPHARGVSQQQLRDVEAYSLKRLREAMAAQEVPVLTVDPTKDPIAAAAVADAIRARHGAG